MESLDDSSLLIGIPFTRSKYLERVGSSDYLSKYALDPEEFWESVYRKGTVEPVERLAEHARKQGIDVYPEATLADIGTASARRNVLIVFSHWKGWEVSNDDILEKDVSRLLQRTASQTEPWAAWLRNRLQNLGILEALNAFLTSDDPALDQPDPAGFTVLEDALTTRSNRRNALDRLLEGFLVPGNRLELADGLYDREAVRRALAPGFGGVFDLTTCRSSFLADHLERTREQDFRIVQFPELLDPHLSCQALQILFDLRIERGLGYLAARKLALDFVATQLSKLVAPVRENPLKSLWRRISG